MYFNWGTGLEREVARHADVQATLLGDFLRWPHELDGFVDRQINFDADFGYRFACRPEDDHAAWRLRYRVYCEETGYLPKEQHLSGYEYDHYDAHSSQGLLIHRESGVLAGTVRLILPLKGRPDAGLPALEHAPQLLRHAESLISLDRLGEISRFSIDPVFRNGPTGSDGVSLPGYVPSKAMPKILLGLAIACLDLATAHNITHLAAVIDPVLLRLLRRVGVNMTPVGPAIAFHGMRQPAWLDVEQTIDEVRRRFPTAAAHLE